MNYAAAAHNHIGRSVIIAGLTLAITALSDKTGKLKNGTDAPYLVLTGPDGQTDMLHPRTATTLFSKGEAAGVKLLVDAVVEAGPIVEAKVELVEPAAVIEVAGTSKKAQAIAIFNAVVAAHGTRAEVIKRFQADVGLSLNGANTYYQNCRGGKWE